MTHTDDYAAEDPAWYAWAVGVDPEVEAWYWAAVAAQEDIPDTVESILQSYAEES